MKKEIEKQLRKIDVKGELQKSLPQYADYTLPCFPMAAELKENPVEIAKDIAQKLQGKIKGAEVKAISGYVNFRVTGFAEIVKEILQKKENYGKGDKKEKIILEHTSINPNASPHVGRARNSIIGDAIARILRFSGKKVKVHYYVNDVSKQVALLSLVCKGNENFDKMLSLYIKAAKKSKDKQVFQVLRKFEQGDSKIRKKIRKIVSTCVKGQVKIFSQLGIRYDKFDYESAYMKEAGSILEQLQKKGAYNDEQGRLVLEQKELSQEMKNPILVLTRSDKTALYVARDLAYTIDKIKQGRNIVVLGEDHKLYFRQLSHALNLLGIKQPEPVFYSFILIQTKKGKKKMSTRKGNLVLLEDFLRQAEEKAKKEIKKRKTKGKAEDIAVAAVKYALLKIEPEKNILFSLDDAVSFEGNTGPYLQYSYARASSILRKIRKKKTKESISFKQNETPLIRKLIIFPDVAEDASVMLKPNLLANYAYELAQEFSRFYETCKVIGDKREKERIMLVEAFCIVMQNCLSLLGIKAIKEM